MTSISEKRSVAPRPSGERSSKPSPQFQEAVPTTTSPNAWSICELGLEGRPIPARQLRYFAARTQNDAHDLVLECYERARQAGMTRAEIARRLQKRPEQVTRWLGSPANWTLETLSNLLVALGQVPEFHAVPISSLKVEQSSSDDGGQSTTITLTFNTQGGMQGLPMNRGAPAPRVYWDVK